MTYVAERIKLIRDLGNTLGISGSLYNIIASMKTGSYTPDNNTLALMKSVILEENPERLKVNIFKILHPDVSEDEIASEDIAGVSLDNLTPNQVVNYLGLMFYGVSFIEHDGLILLKYNNCIYNTGWFKLAMASRGIVLDSETLEVVGHPFDKFFNINERPEYSEVCVNKHIANARALSLSEKKDGTLIAVYSYKGKARISTNGALVNDYIQWGYDLFAEKYPHFLSTVHPGYTYIFEMVIPETHCVINYGNERTMYLIAVRDMSTDRFWDYPQLKDFAEENSLDITDSEEFTSIDDIIKRASTLRNANMEGWVLKINEPDGDFFVKIKLSEYFVLHRMASSISLRRVYNLYVQDELDSYLENATPKIIEDASGLVEEIEITKEKYFELVREKAEKVAEEYGIHGSLENQPEKLKEMVRVLGASHVFLYLKNPERLRNTLNYLSWKSFEKIMSEV